MSGMLSPSEIHSLLTGLDLVRGANSGAVSADSASTAPLSADQFTLPLELAVDERHGLQAWQAAFAQRWQQTWPESIRRRWSIVDIACSVTRLRDFIAANASRHRFQVATTASEFTHWLTIDTCLVTGHLDALLGASDTEPITGGYRISGPLEHQLTGRLVNGISDSLFPHLPGVNRSGWKISVVDSAEDWLAGVPVFLSCELVEFEIEVSCRGTVGHLHIGIPRALVSRCPDPRPSLGTSSVPPIIGSSGESVSLRATLNPVSLSQAQFDQLQVGDVLLTGEDAQGICQVSINGQPRFQATIGSHQGQKAIRLIANLQ